MKNLAYISLGSNLGDSQSVIEEAYEVIEDRIGTLIKKSSFYKTKPWGFEAENDFVNSMILVETNFSAHDLLQNLLNIEKEFGRIRIETEGYQSRILDLDIIDFNGEHFETENLVVPHPQMHLRSFVLVPLREIAAEWKHPVLGADIQKLTDDLDSSEEVVKL